MVGRSPYCTIVLANTRASRRHCAIRLENEELWLEDLESSNGTWVNQERVVGRAKIGHGDVVRIGTDVLEIQTEAEGSLSIAEVRRETVGHMDAVLGSELDSTTTLEALSIDFIEDLVSGASQAADPARTSDSMRRALDELLAQRTKSGAPLAPSESARMLKAAEAIVSYNPSGLGQIWLDRIRAKLGAP